MLNENRRTHLSLAKETNKERDASDMDMESDEQSVEHIIEEVVGQEKWAGKRAGKLDLDDFLTLLAEFNTRGIHFA